jgi:FkbH-like protein
MGGSAAAERALARVDWEPFVFAATPRRLALARLVPAWPLEPLRLSVLRNRVFEPIASALATFAAYAGWRLDLRLGPYDDALSASGAVASDVELLWLDYARYRLDGDALAAYVADRASSRAASTRKPVIVASDDRIGRPAATLNSALAERLAGVAGVDLLDLASVARRVGRAYRDERLRALGASDLTDLGALEIALELAFRSLPPVTRPRLKLVAVDLDNTLVDGVIGEDGVDGVAIGPHRQAFARTLADLCARGVLIALVSRNDQSDVERLFEIRRDLPLPRASLFALEAGWGSKAEALARIVERARVGMDSVLFVDDNPGELAAVAAAHPAVHLLSAADAGLASRAIATYPGLHGYAVGREDALRTADLNADVARAAARATADSEESFLRSLGVVVELALDDPAAQERAAALSLKTNQFNTSLRRFTVAEIAERVAATDARVVTASLRDRLSDSGIVASIVARGRDRLLDVEEVAMSCRALGRGIEARLLAEGIVWAAASLGCDHARFAFRSGPRNVPARAWLAGLVGCDPAEEPVVPIERLTAILVPDPPFSIKRGVWPQ